MTRVRARVRVGSTLVNVQGLQFSAEVGGGGVLSFKAKASVIAAAGGMLDSTITTVELDPTDTNTWVPIGLYAIRPPFAREKVGIDLMSFSAVTLLESWASSTVFYPEYVSNVMIRDAGTERGLGWMNSAYDWAADPYEAWDRTSLPPRSYLPEGWPAGSTAVWITATTVPGDTTYVNSERKLFRSSLTVPGTEAEVIKIYFSSDEGGDVWIGGEKVLEASYSEEGWKYVESATLILQPGTYAVGIDTLTQVSKGGDGVDPVLFAAYLTDDLVNPTTQLVATSAAWGACRRNDEGLGSEPPGPGAGAVVRDIILEAAARNTVGWAGVTFGFTNTTDSYGHAWAMITERIVRYGHDDYWQFLQGLGEAGEADVWLEPGLVLQAANRQGQLRDITLTETSIPTMNDSYIEDHGTSVMARTYGGWVYVEVTGAWRREFALEVGQAVDVHTGYRVAAAALEQVGRWDATIKYHTGPVPFVDFKLGDWLTVAYRDVSRVVRVLSIGAEAGEGGLLWSITVTNEAAPAPIGLRRAAAPEASQIRWLGGGYYRYGEDITPEAVR